MITVNEENNMAKSYEEAGVNLEAGYEVVRRIKSHVASTARLGTMGNIGAFGGMFDLSKLAVKEPVLVSGTDGVGTKLKLAFEMDKHDTIGIDADRVVLVHLEGEFEFGAHAVGAAHQNRLLNGEFRQVEHASESAYVAHRAEACGRCHMRLDASDDLVSGFEIDTGFFVTFCHIVFFVNSYHYFCSGRHCGTDRLRSGRRSRPCRARCGVRPRAEPPARGTPTNRPR